LKLLDKDKLRKYLLGRKDTLYTQYKQHCVNEAICTDMDDVIEAQRQETIISSAIDEVDMILDNLDDYTYDMFPVVKGGAIIFRFEDAIDDSLSEWLRLCDELKKADITAVAVCNLDFDTYDDKKLMADDLEQLVKKLREEMKSDE
jgi:hypothetical protein